MELTKRIEMISGLGLVALVVAGCLLVLTPFATALLWAAVICFATWPIHRRVERLCRHRRTLAAGITTGLVVVFTVLPFVLTASVLDRNMADLIASAQALGTQGLPPPPDWVGRIPLAGDYLRDYWAVLATDSDKSYIFFKMLLAQSKTWVFHRCMDFGLGLVHLCLSVFVAFFFYRDGERLVERVSEVGRRVFGETSQHLIMTVGRTVRGVVYGILGTALGQGVTGAIGFAIAGVPWAPMLGVLTFVLALIPFGAPLIWIGATVWLISQGHVGWSVFMALWGFFAISGIDNFLRPYLISREAQLPFVLVFLGAMGGIVAFGFIGLFLGPTLLAVGYALLHEFLRPKTEVAAAIEGEAKVEATPRMP
jgi:predicted PurR-regulated permease PerM